MRLSAKAIPEFRRRLLRWFRRRKRELPWRGTPDPYHIWLSEIMLQQTRVAAVVPYYQRFLKRFPTMQALAQGRSEEVLRLWAGLGYYSRARNLHRAAKEIIARHGGRFPREFDAALRLSGIGGYTAAAVLSIAYGSRFAVLDGNVARVLARLTALRSELRAPRCWKRLQGIAQDLLAPSAPGDWNQAMMELGATVCTPKSPRCGQCPIARWCRAYALDLAEKLPAARKKRAPVNLKIAAAVLLDPRGRTLVVKDEDDTSRGQDGALFSRMWQFPTVTVAGDAQVELRRHLQSSLGVGAAGLLPLPAARHRVTFREITLLPFLLRVRTLRTRGPLFRGGGVARRTPMLTKLDRLAVSGATRKIAAAALSQKDDKVARG